MPHGYNRKILHIDDLPAIAKANELCNRYGMHTISCDATGPEIDS